MVRNAKFSFGHTEHVVRQANKSYLNAFENTTTSLCLRDDKVYGYSMTEEEEGLTLGLCATLLGPSSIDAWKTTKGGQCLAFAQFIKIYHKRCPWTVEV